MYTEGVRTWPAYAPVCVCSYLWVFVSQFTDFDASRLHRLYKQALKKQQAQRPATSVFGWRRGVVVRGVRQ